MNRLLTLALLALVVATPARATTARLDSLLQAHADSMGLSRQTVDEDCWHVIEEIEGLGLNGTSETWAQAPASIRSRIRIGPLSLETWFDGEDGWISDRNGTSRKAEGTEMDGMLGQALFSSGAWLLKPPPVPLSLKLEEFNADSLVIVCTPLLEQPLRVILDTQTLLPRATVATNPAGNQIQTYTEWGWLDGERVALAAKLDLAGLATLSSHVSEMERMPRQPDAFFRPDFAEDGAQLPDDIHFPTTLTPVPILGKGLHLTVEGWIENREGNEISLVYLVDTGAGASFVDSGVAERLGLSGNGEVPTLGVGGNATSQFIEVPAIGLGGVRLGKQSWMSSDFSGIRSWFANPPSAVLGYDFLSRTILEVDYAARELRFHAPGTFVAPESATPLPLRMDANIPSIEISIEGKPAWVHVDTGSNSGLDLAQPFVEKNAMLLGRRTSVGAGLRGIGGSSKSRQGTVEWIEIGDHRLEQVATGFNEAEEGIFARASIDGILGAALLSRFRCVFDYPARQLWLLDAETP